MRFIGTLIFLGAFAFGGWWVWNHYPGVRTFVYKQIETGEFQTLEIRHTAQQIMNEHKNSLLKNSQHSFLEPTLLYYPYLLLEVKYNVNERETSEGVMLWGLLDGEVVINSDTWEKSHGFEDCINGDASREDFKVINALAKNKGTMDRKQLLEALHVEPEMLDGWLDSARRKKLIVQNGNSYRLHFNNPRMQVVPETKMSESLVAKPAEEAKRIPRRYSPSQIESIAKVAFSNNFTIRNSTTVYLPVYSIQVKNPDGSTLTSYWNALTSQRMKDVFFQ